MKKAAVSRSAVLAALLALAQPAWAGKLDTDFIRTSPTKALVYSVAFPGGGHYYLSRKEPKYKGKFYLFLCAGAASGVLLAAGMNNKHSLLFPAAVLAAGGVKIWEFGAVTDDAETERLKLLKESFAAAGAPEKGAEK